MNSLIDTFIFSFPRCQQRQRERECILKQATLFNSQVFTNHKTLTCNCYTLGEREKTRERERVINEEREREREGTTAASVSLQESMLVADNSGEDL